MAQFRNITLPEDHLVACTNCGAAVADQGVHSQFHLFTGQPVDLSGLGGANDVPPLPPKDGS